MEYTYSELYGTHGPGITIKISERKSIVLCQDELDDAVNKGLIQNMKEDKMTFEQLMKVLEKERIAGYTTVVTWPKPKKN
jgi:hypothetical protein